ncbi:valyl-tRNA synthetase [Sinorhizobium fredii]
MAAEKARLEKAIAKVDVERERILGKLANEKFVANAKPELVEAERERLAELNLQKDSLGVALSRVSEAG